MNILKKMFRPQKPIEIFVRHCHYSAISQHKVRFPNFSKEKVFRNLLQTIQGENVSLTILLDTFHPMDKVHFVKLQSDYPVVEISEGTETGSFLRLLDLALERVRDPEAIIYFLEDDYLHVPGWVKILREGISLPNVDYVTLYDHFDKYTELYHDLRSRIYCSQSTHWRSTPSTTNTFAMQLKTLKRDIDIHRSFSTGVKITLDHQKFCELATKGATLISSIPGWSTHAEAEFASPCIVWEKLLNPQLGTVL